LNRNDNSRKETQVFFLFFPRRELGHNQKVKNKSELVQSSEKVFLTFSQTNFRFQEPSMSDMCFFKDLTAKREQNKQVI